MEEQVLSFYRLQCKLIVDKKAKHMIRIANQNFFYMAGLYNSSVDKNGNPYADSNCLMIPQIEFSEIDLASSCSKMT